MITTFLFEQNNLQREGLKSYLAGTNYRVTAEFRDIEEFVPSDHACSPNLIITGVNMQPDDPANGSSNFKKLINHIRACHPGARLVILTSVQEIRLMPQILGYQADGFILCNISREAILNYLNLAMIGEKVLPCSLVLLFSTLRTEPNVAALSLPLGDVPLLSDRESDVVQCLALGESNKLIARRLNITESTVKGHLKIILRKLGVQNRTQAALVAFRHSDTHLPYSNEAVAA